MTDEQIKQNAETAYPGFEDLQAVYIEGAHSRDEEIKELEERIKVLDMNLVEQQLENLQLRNQWISVKERLPRDEDYDDENIYCFLVRQECGFIYNCAFDGEEWLTNAPDGEEWGVGGVTHWMQIPELKK